MRIHVIGAGIIGLACAHELTRRGHRVVVVDPSPGSGASHAAAGMLAPAGEAWHGEPEAWDLGVRSASLWPSYAAALGVSLHRTGTLLVGHDAADAQLVRRQGDLLAGLGVAVADLGPRELRRHEPTLGRTTAGLLLPDDHAVDPRAAHAHPAGAHDAERVCGRRAGVPVRRSAVPVLSLRAAERIGFRAGHHLGG